MKKKILIVDDQPDFGTMIKINLESSGPYEVDVCLNGEEGVAKVKEKKFDLIFLDVLMPKMEGHVAIKEMKAICDTPVVIMSAYLPPHARKEILDAGAYATLEKPVKMQQFMDVIKDVLKS